MPPPAFCVSCNCAAWEQRREDKMPGSGCGAIICDRERGCINKDWAAKVAEGRKE